MPRLNLNDDGMSCFTEILIEEMGSEISLVS